MMCKRLMEKYREKRGFTLIEMLIVLAVMGVLIGLVSVNIHGYLVTSYMNRVNETAKTVFLASQNYLTQQKQMGQLSTFNEKASLLEHSNDTAGHPYSRKLSKEEIKAILSANDPAFDWEVYQAKYSTDTIRYLAMNGTAEPSNPLYGIVKDYLNDPDILEHTFLLEYDTRTGVVRSVFYSEKTESLADYAAGSREDKSNVVLRDYDSLRPKRQGYYGVHTSGMVAEDAIDLYIPKEVALVNGERLYLQWTESNYLSSAEIAAGNTTNRNEAFDDPELKKFLVYDVEVFGKAKEGSTGDSRLLFTVKSVGLKAPDGTPWKTTLDTADDAGVDLVDTGLDILEISKKTPVIALDTQTNTYTLLLDDIHHSIFNTYNQENAALAGYYATVYDSVRADDSLYCKVVPRLLDTAPVSADEIESSAVSNLQSACYAGGAEFTDNTLAGAPFTPVRVFGNGYETENGTDKTKGRAFSISTVRHFNNIRYASNISHFRQIPLKLTDQAAGIYPSIDWERPEHYQSPGGRGRYYRDYFEPFQFKTGENGLESDLNKEVFYASYVVENVGGKQCTLENIKIDKLKAVSPEKYVGIFRKLGRRGSENALIDGLYLKGIRVSGGCYVGAVAGMSQGTIQNVTITQGAGLANPQVVSELKGGYYVGGITGVNAAGAQLRGIQVDMTVTGGQFGAAVAPEGTGSDKVSSGHYIGGVAGLNEGNAGIGGTDGKIVTAVLNSSNLASTPQRTVTGTKYVGGVFGAVRTPASGSSKTENLVNYNNLGICEDVPSYPSESLQNFGGITGYNGKDSELKNAVNKGQLRLVCSALTASGGQPWQPENIGGVAGTNEGSLKDCKNALEKGSLVDAAIRDCVRELKKQGAKLPVYIGTSVGGIAGYNTAAGRLSGCLNENGVVTGYTVVGGLIGRNEGKSDYTVSGVLSEIGQSLSGLGRAGTVSVQGIVAGTGNIVGGIYGSNTGDTDGGVNKAHVFGRAVVGGIIGQNGGTGNYAYGGDGEEPQLGAGQDIRKYLEPYSLAAADTSATIKNCSNSGFIYASRDYAGGITGINMGKISECNSMVSMGSVLSAELGGEAGLSALAKADCVGGIVGLNAQNAELRRIGATPQPSGAYLYVDNFGGGIAGINHGVLKGYTTIKGNIYGKGQAVGGFIGMNLEKDILNNNIINDSMKISGSYFVGGIIGLNIATGESAGGEPLTIIGTTQNTGSEKGRVSGDAYVGGIIGYNTYADDENALTGLYNNELTKLIENAYEVYIPGESGGPANSILTIFKDCYSHTEVTANRYAGGIVGYNSKEANLWISGCINYGAVSIKDETKSKDRSYYFIGGITGRNSSNGVIDQCINDGAVKSPSKYLGGLCEVNEGYVQYCRAGATAVDQAAITGSNSVGGLVGLNSAKVVCCHAGEFANIKGGSDTGGLVGTNDVNGIISGRKSNAMNLDRISGWSEPAAAASCTSNATIYGTGNNIGGIVGLNQGAVEQIFVETKAKIEGVNNVGGFIGNNEGTIDGSASAEKEIRSLTNNASSVKGVHLVGGIVGVHNAMKIVDCVNNGRVEATGEDRYNANGYAGGITGKLDQNVRIEGCVNYGVVVSAEGVAGGITGYNQGIVKDSRNYGTVEGATLNLNDRKAVGGVVGNNSKEGSVINCISGDWKSDPNRSDNPHQNVKNHENYIYGQAIVGGLIGRNSGVIENDKADSRNVSIQMRTDGECRQKQSTQLGGVVGMLEGETKLLEDFVYSGTIKTEMNCVGTKYIGGIVGRLEAGYELENCSFEGSIRGYANSNAGDGGVGGLAGRSNGTIIVYGSREEGNTLYSAGTKDSFVEGRSNVGGLVGYAGDGHKLLLKKESDALIQPDSTHFYTNLTSVSGKTRVGGCYGLTVLSELSNYCNRGDILLPANDWGSGTPTYVGGILGYPENKITLTECINEGTIGQDAGRNGMYVGGVVGRTAKASVLLRCENKGSICDGNQNIGGLVGELADGSHLRDCTNSGDMKLRNADHVGGLVGSLQDSSIEGSVNLGDVKGLSRSKVGVGGIFGLAEGTSKVNQVQNNGLIEGWNAKTGGIGGWLKADSSSAASKVTISSCTNKGEVIGFGRTGGILGEVLYQSRADHSLQFYENTNEAKVTGRDNTGGLIGYFNATVQLVDTQIKNCLNKGTVYGNFMQGRETETGNVLQTGGCIGYLSAYDRITGFVNEGAILVERTGSVSRDVVSVGGIVGDIRQKNTEPLSQCINRGTIKVSNFRHITAVAGIGGFTRTKSVLSECRNTRDIELDKISGAVKYIGGITGQSIDATRLEDCENEGTVLLTKDPSQVLGVGGITGRAQHSTLISGCTNRATFDFTSVKTKATTELGGIAGYAYHDRDGEKVKLQYCKNYGSILGNTEWADHVGGIVGRTDGLVYSCSTLNKTGEKGRVSGRNNVGGLVGLAENTTCKITSIRSRGGTGYDYSINHFNVSGTGAVGGAVGKMSSATLQTVYVDGGVTITALNASAAGDRRVGGIVGFNDFVNNQGDTYQGVIANCYGFGKVEFDAAVQKHQYLGGITGYRNGHNQPEPTRKAAAIKHSYYLWDDAAYKDQVSASEPDNALPAYPGRAVLAVGNEPEGRFYRDEEDGEAEADRLDDKERYRWSQETYQKLYRILHNTDPADPVPGEAFWDKLETVLEYIAPVYDLNKLPVPETKPVTGDRDFLYQMPVHKIPGFCKEIQVSLYDYELDTELIEAGEQTPLLRIISKVGMDEQLQDITINIKNIRNYAQWVGKPVKVTIQAMGYTDESEGQEDLIYTVDSDLSVVQNFVIMPPLPIPQMPVLTAVDKPAAEVLLVEQDDTKLTFRIKNWEKYNKVGEPKRDYPNLTGQPLYEQYFMGLKELKIIDYFKTTAGQNINDSYRTTWTIPRDQITTDGKFTIDYQGIPQYESYKGSRKWHEWKITAEAEHQGRPISMEAVEAEPVNYRYFSSEVGKAVYYVEAKTQLEPPTNLKWMYQGDRDWEKEELTPSYRLTFSQSVSPKTAIAGYRLVIANTENEKTVTIHIPQTEIGTLNPYSCVLGKEQLMDMDVLNGLGAALEPETDITKLSWSLQTLKREDVVNYMDSDAVNGEEIPMLKKEAAVKRMDITRIEGANDHTLLLDWSKDNDTSAELTGNRYTLTYKLTFKRDDGTIFESVFEPAVLNGTNAKSYLLDFKRLGGDAAAFYQNGYTLEASIVRHGEKKGAEVLSLHSNQEVYTYIGKADMKPVQNIKAGFDRIDWEKDTEGRETAAAVFQVMWDNPIHTDAANCAGFDILFLMDGSQTELARMSVPFSETWTVPYELIVPLNKISGGKYRVQVITKSEGDAKEASEQSSTIVMPTEYLDAPILKSVKGKTTDNRENILSGSDETKVTPLLPEVLKELSYALEWSNTQIGRGIVEGRIIRLLDENGDLLLDQDGNAVVYDRTASGMETEIEFAPELTAILFPYAGRELQLEVVLQSKDSARTLPSRPGRLTFFIPKIQLKAPEAGTGTVDPGIGTMTASAEWKHEAEEEGRKGQRVTIRGIDADGDEIVIAREVGHKQGEITEIIFDDSDTSDPSNQELVDQGIEKITLISEESKGSAEIIFKDSWNGKPLEITVGGFIEDTLPSDPYPRYADSETTVLLSINMPVTLETEMESSILEETSQEESTTEEHISEESTAEESTREENNTEEGTSGENRTEEGTSGENRTEEGTSGESRTEEGTSGENRTEEGTSGENRTEKGTSEENTTEQGSSG